MFRYVAWEVIEKSLEALKKFKKSTFVAWEVLEKIIFKVLENFV